MSTPIAPLERGRVIGAGGIEDYLYSIPGIGGKTRANTCSALHDFWAWCRRRKVITLAEFAEFPEIEYKLGYRKVTTWKVQEQVLAKIKELSYGKNRKIWFGIELLATYGVNAPFGPKYFSVWWTKAASEVGLEGVPLYPGTNGGANSSRPQPSLQPPTTQ
ncbi:MAG: hypothetical protein ACOX2W_14270 [Desulfomonilia bacterium]|jgi:hypothetical protein